MCIKLRNGRDSVKRGICRISSVQTIDFHNASPPYHDVESSQHVFLSNGQLLGAHDDVVDGDVDELDKEPNEALKDKT